LAGGFVNQLGININFVDKEGDGKLEPGDRAYLKVNVTNKLKKSSPPVKLVVDVLSQDYKDEVEFGKVKTKKIKGWEIQTYQIPIRVSPFIHTGQLHIKVKALFGKKVIAERELLILVMGKSEIYKR